MTEFTPLLSLVGGALIGLSAVLLMAFHGRIAGVTRHHGRPLPPGAPDWAWRAAFLAGAIAAPMILVAALGVDIPFDSPAPTAWLIVGGLIVGIGVHLGSGCTSGHGVCGIARLSNRSFAATRLHGLDRRHRLRHPPSLGRLY